MRKIFDASTALILTLSITGAILVFRRDGLDRVWEILSEDLIFFIEVVPKVLAGCFIGAFLPQVLPKEAISRSLGGESGLKGLVLATLIGIVMPGGPFTVYPVGASLYMIGAGVGPVTAFVTSWTLLGFNRAVVYEMPFMGAHFVLVRSVMSLFLPILAGYGAQWLERRFLKPEDNR